MSLNYTHFLIPDDSSYCPSPAQVADFLARVSPQGFIGPAAKLAISEVTKLPRETKQSFNPFTRGMTETLTPSRKRSRFKAVSEIGGLEKALAKLSEYEVSLTTEKKPKLPPLEIGTDYETGEWEPFDKAYAFELLCCARESAVTLSFVEKPKSLKANPEDLIPAEFGEDSKKGRCDGYFVHPEAGVLKVAGAGCGRFWVEMQYGKFLYPRLKNKKVDVLAKPFVKLVEETMGCKFLQGCSWG